MDRLFPRTDRDIAFPAVGSIALFAVFVLGGLAYQGLLGTGSAERLVTVMLIDAIICLLYTSPSPRDATLSRMPSSA